MFRVPNIVRVFAMQKKCARVISTTFMVASEPKVKSAEEFDRLVTKTRRPVTRKRRSVTANLPKVGVREPSVVSSAISESIDLVGIVHDPVINNMFNITYIDEEFDDALHLVKKPEYTLRPDEISELYIFQDGAIVFWNVEGSQRAQLLRDIEKYLTSSYDSIVVMEEQDRMPFTIVEGASNIRHDRFYLNTAKHGSDNKKYDAILERFAFSQGFAASVKVGVWEYFLNNLAEPLSDTTKSLTQGVVPWSRREALKRSGEFAALRHSINLDCSLLNTDFYWNRVDIERYYDLATRHFAINRRLQKLNSRLDYCEELVKMVDNTLALRHASKLEWMIIVLIVIEVFFDVFHFADRKPKEVIVISKPVVE